MVIGIDIDDTICSTNERIIVEADKYDKEVLGGTGIKDEKAYEFTEMMGWEKEMKGQFFADRLEYIMDNAEIKPGAVEIINRLHNEGNKIVSHIGNLLLIVVKISLIAAPVLAVTIPIFLGTLGIFFFLSVSNNPSEASFFFNFSNSTYKFPSPTTNIGALLSICFSINTFNSFVTTSDVF